MSNQSQAYRAIERHMRKKYEECPECKSFKLLNIGGTILAIGVIPVLIVALIIFVLSGIYFSLGIIVIWFIVFLWQKNRYKCMDCRQSYKSVKGEDGIRYLEWESDD